MSDKLKTSLEKCFSELVESVFHVTQVQVIAIDGKTMRGSHDKMIGKNAIHRVNGFVLFQYAEYNRIVVLFVAPKKKFVLP